MDNPLFFLLLGIIVAWVFSYFYSMQHNRRKLIWLARWLEDSLPILGGRSSSRWLNQDTLSINLTEGKGRIREAAIVLGAQRRDFFSMLLSVLRGGKDSMSIILAINPPTRVGWEFEVFKKGAPVPRTVMLGLGGVQDWEIEDYPRGAPYQVAARLPKSREVAHRLIALLNDDNYDIRRISVRPTTPHVMIVLNISQLPRTNSHDLIQLVRNLAEEISGTSSKLPEDNIALRQSLKPRKRRSPKASTPAVDPILALDDHKIRDNIGQPGDPSAN